MEQIQHISQGLGHGAQVSFWRWESRDSGGNYSPERIEDFKSFAPPPFAILQYLKQLLDCRHKPIWILLNRSSLAKFSPTFFGFASQGFRLQTRHRPFLTFSTNCRLVCSTSARLIKGRKAIGPPNNCPP